MSDTMLNAVIRMPYEMAMASEPSRIQFYNRAQSLLVERAADKARIAELEAALKPFASAAERFRPRNRKLADARRDQAIIWSACDGEYVITVQDLRTADAALSQQGKEGE